MLVQTKTEYTVLTSLLPSLQLSVLARLAVVIALSLREGERWIWRQGWNRKINTSPNILVACFLG